MSVQRTETTASKCAPTWRAASSAAATQALLSPPTAEPVSVSLVAELVNTLCILRNQCSVDNDECAANNGGCQQRCTNTAGGHSCSCFSGYRINSGDRRTCLGESRQHHLIHVYTIPPPTIRAASILHLAYYTVVT